jgi:hypothetical protein
MQKLSSVGKFHDVPPGVAAGVRVDAQYVADEADMLADSTSAAIAMIGISARSRWQLR